MPAALWPRAPAIGALTDPREQAHWVISSSMDTLQEGSPALPTSTLIHCCRDEPLEMSLELIISAQFWKPQSELTQIITSSSKGWTCQHRKALLPWDCHSCREYQKRSFISWAATCLLGCGYLWFIQTLPLELWVQEEVSCFCYSFSHSSETDSYTNTF